MSDVLSGAKLKLFLGTVEVARANNCSYTVNHNHQPIEVFGDVLVKEHVELGATVEFSASMFRIKAGAATALGISPNMDAILSQPTLVMTVVANDNTTLIKIIGVKLTSRSGSVDARGVFTETLNFVGTKATDDSSAGSAV